MTALRDARFVTLGWQAWSVVVVVLALVFLGVAVVLTLAR